VKKMSQSLGNYVSVRDDPGEMFGKTMSIPDEAMAQWLSLAAGFTEVEVAAIVDGLAAGDLHPGDTKRRLARAVVARYWGSEAAKAAEEGFDLLFRHHQIPGEIADFPLPNEDPVRLPALMSAAGLVSSNGEGRRMLAQGAVKLDGEPFSEELIPRAALAGRVLQVGKRRFMRLVAP
jgi:tyrosyl-tRNA synthetase